MLIKHINNNNKLIIITNQEVHINSEVIANRPVIHVVIKNEKRKHPHR